MTEPDWRSGNRANWDERVAIHLKAPCYELESLRAGRGRLNPIEEARGARSLRRCAFTGRTGWIILAHAATTDTNAGQGGLQP
jgi:hypothetical protein